MNARKDSKRLSFENARLAGDLTRANEELAWVAAKTKKNEEAWKGEASSLRAELEGLRSKLVTSQGPPLQALLYKIIRTNDFGEYLNAYGGIINSLVMIEAIEVISLDHAHLDLKKPGNGYNKDAREQSGWRMTEEMLKVSGLCLLDSLKSNDHILSVEEVLNSKVDEDLMLRDLDKAGIVYPLSPPMSPTRPDMMVILLQNLPESEDPASFDLPPFGNIV